MVMSGICILYQMCKVSLYQDGLSLPYLSKYWIEKCVTLKNWLILQLLIFYTYISEVCVPPLCLSSKVHKFHSMKIHE